MKDFLLEHVSFLKNKLASNLVIHRGDIQELEDRIKATFADAVRVAEELVDLTPTDETPAE